MTGLAYYWGDDLFALEAAAEALRAGLGRSDAPAERWRTTGAETSAEGLVERVATAPLFGGGTVVVVSEPGPLVRSKEAREALSAVIGAIAPGNGLVFLDAVDGSGRRAAGLDRLRDEVAAAGGDVREFRAPTEGKLSGWIEARARERGVALGRGAAQELATRVGGFVREGDVDRRRQGQLAVAELEKLALYRAGAEVSVDDVRTLVAEAVPGSTWALLDAIATRRARRAGELLETLLATTPEPVLVALLHRRLRELLEVADRLAAGETDASLVRSMKLKPYRAEVLGRAARAWEPDELVAALDGLLELDALAKGAGGRTATDAQRRLAFTLWVEERVGAGGDPRPTGSSTPGAARDGAPTRRSARPAPG